MAYYRGRCLQCHETHGCSESLPRRLATSKEDSCIDCHMKRYEASDIVHAATTNHRIPLRSEGPPPGRPGQPIPAGRLTHFYRDRLDTHDREGSRDLGLGLAQFAGQFPTARKKLALQAVDLLETPLKAFPDDLPAWEARGQALAVVDRSGAALQAFEQVLARAPGREAALVGAATAAERLNRPDQAQDYWRRAVKANPWSPFYRRGLASALMDARLWDEALAQARAWLGLLPGDIDARMMTAVCLWQIGQREAARAEFTHIEALHPPHLEQMRAWFKQLQRSGGQ